MPVKNKGNQGSLQPDALAGEYNTLVYVIRQLMSQMETAMPVEVVACTNAGAISAVGLVDVKPLINQVDGNNQPVPQTTVFGLPYVRLQGGANAVVIDPEPGDIGVAVFASRDISTVKATKAAATPASKRVYSMSDGMFIGGGLNAAPTQYIQFNATGITVHSPTKVAVQAPRVDVNCQTATIEATTSLTVTSPLSKFDGNVTVTGLLTGQGGIAMTGGSGAQFDCNINSTGGISASTSLKVNGIEVLGHDHTGDSGGTTGPMK